MALAITSPTSLPDGRTGLDYEKVGITATATGGSGTVTWSLDSGGTAPAGLVIDSATGKLSGFITAAAGNYEPWIKATDSASPTPATAIAKIPLFVSGLPNGLDLLLRLPVKDQPGAVLTQLNLIARTALQMITDACGVPFATYGTTAVPQFGPEILHRNTYSPLGFPENRPIQSIVAAVDGSQTLRIGTLQALMGGSADIAIDNAGKAVRLLSPARWDGPSYVAVTYTAGFAILPPDLYEVFCEIGLMLWKERERIGLSELTVDQGTTKYQKELPQLVLGVLERYGRIGQWV